MSPNEINNLSKGYIKSRMSEFKYIDPVLRNEIQNMMERDFIKAISWIQKDYCIISKRVFL